MPAICSEDKKSKAFWPQILYQNWNLSKHKTKLIVKQSEKGAEVKLNKANFFSTSGESWWLKHCIEIGDHILPATK